jgi:hypothetical protein
MNLNKIYFCIAEELMSHLRHVRFHTSIHCVS